MADNKREKRKAALEWIKGLELKSEPSFSAQLSGTREEQDFIAALPKSEKAKQLGLNIQVTHHGRRVTFTGEDTLMYLARKGIKFPDSEGYEARLEMGQALVESAAVGDTARVKHLLSAGAYPNFRHPKESQDSALHFAAATSNVEMTEALLKAGTNPNIGNENGDTPLHFARERVDPTALLTSDALKVVELLCKYGADPDLGNGIGSSPYKEAEDRQQKNAMSVMSPYRKNIKAVNSPAKRWADDLGKREGNKLG